MTHNGRRTTFLDFDARRDPRTDRFCIRCQRDLRPGMRARVVWMVPGEPMLVHPEDRDGSEESWLLGPECLRRVGAEWTTGEVERA